jgi:hypothetical protein
VGGTLLLLTGLARRLFGVPADQDNGALRLTARLFGIRNIVLGTWALAGQDQDRDTRRLCYQLNAATDAVDLGVLALGALKGDRLWRPAMRGTALGGSALLAWLDLLDDVEIEDDGASEELQRPTTRAR